MTSPFIKIFPKSRLGKMPPFPPPTLRTPMSTTSAFQLLHNLISVLDMQHNMSWINHVTCPRWALFLNCIPPLDLLFHTNPEELTSIWLELSHHLLAKGESEWEEGSSALAWSYCMTTAKNYSGNMNNLVVIVAAGVGWQLGRTEWENAICLILIICFKLCFNCVLF